LRNGGKSSDLDSDMDIHNANDEKYFNKCLLTFYSLSMMDSILAPGMQINDR